MHAGQAFKISGDLGSQEYGINAIVRVYATQNADGTGYKILLAEVSRLGTLVMDITYFTWMARRVTGYGRNSLDGFYAR